MFNRKNFKDFVDNSVITYKTNDNPHDLRVDPYGIFEIIFEVIPDTSFANSAKIKTYGNGLGNLLFSSDTKLHKFIKSINDVELNINSKTLDIPGASYAIHRLMPMNSSPHIQMSWLSTKEPFIENVFVPWMEDNTLYGLFPLVKCNLKITFPELEVNSNSKIVYWYYGVRPIEVGLHKMTNEPVQDFYRKVTFDFDYFLVKPE